MTEFIGNQIRLARKRRGFSQRELAERAYVTQSQISHLEKGGDVQMHTFLRIIQAMDLQMAILPFLESDLAQREAAGYKDDGPLYRLGDDEDEE